MDRLSTDDSQMNSMMATEQEALGVAEAAEHYFQITAQMSEITMPFFDRQEFAPDPTEIAIIAATQPNVAMVDPGSGSAVIQLSDFMVFDSAEVSSASQEMVADAIPMSNPGEAIASTSAVAAGLGEGGSIDITE
jgi:hypothetical protein